MAGRKSTKTTVVEEEKSIIDEIKEDTSSISEEIVAEKPKNKFSDNDYILCRSVTAGGLHITCRSRNFYYFKDYGSECEIEYRDLVELVRKHSDHIWNPRFIIVDKDFVVEFPQLQKFYSELYSIGDLREILTYPVDKLEIAIKQLPEEMIPTLKNLAATMVGSGEIDSVRTIRTLDDIFGTDLNLLGELFGKN